MGALVVALAFCADGLGLLAPVDRVMSDTRFSLAAVPPSENLALVDIDAHSLETIGVWPWPRSIYADLIRRLEAMGVAQLAFDIDFSTRSDAVSDAAFAEALAHSSMPVFLAAFAQPSRNGRSEITLNLPRPEFAANAWPALVNVPLDPDGYIRRFPSRLDVQGEILEALPSVLSAMGDVPQSVVIDFAINAAAIPHYSLADVLSGQVSSGSLKGRTVIVGANALELRDFFSVPRLGAIAGSELIALATETITANRSLRALPGWWVILAAGLLSAAVFLMVEGKQRPFIMLGCLSLLIELGAALLQLDFRLITATAGAELTILGFAAAAIAREFDLGKFLLQLARSEARNTHQMLQRVVDDGFDGVAIFDEADNVVRINGAAQAILQLQPELGSAPRATTVLPAAVLDKISAVRRMEPDEGTTRALSGEADLFDGTRFIEFTVAPIAVEERLFTRVRQLTFVCLTVRDITERHLAAQRLRHQATHDSLTELFNRRGLSEAVDQHDVPSGLAILTYFDLDRFKIVNDTLGHQVGDELLKQVARRASETVRSGNVLARIGGDEFAIFSSFGKDQAFDEARAIGEALAKPFLIAGHRLSVGVSFGIAESEGPQGNIEGLMRRADLALHRAKRSGMHRIVMFDSELEAEQLLRLELEQELAGALERGEMEVVFQPQFCIRSGKLTGAEALLRWHHPTRGYVSPADFIPIAEECGAIHKLSSWVMNQACAAASTWPQHLKVAVNISPTDLIAGDVPKLVDEAVRAADLDPGRIEIEITESAFIEGGPAITAAFEQLRGLGVGFALDDFGTGYSSLGYLHRFPFSKLKIDRSFVSGIPSDGDAMAILRSIVSLAHGLGLQMIAEGIETESQREALLLLGCELGQGYLFSKPISPAQFIELIGRQQSEPLRISA